MTLIGFFRTLYRIITYPFKAIWKYFHPLDKTVIVIPQNNVPMPYKYFFKFSNRTVRKTPREIEGLEGTVHHDFLFKPIWFSHEQESKKYSSPEKGQEEIEDSPKNVK